MVADTVRAVGADLVQVQALIGEGVDPHLYKSTPRDIQLLTSADVIFYSGLHLEGKMARVFESLGKSRDVVAVTSTIPESNLLSDGELHDPHVWFDVNLWSQTISAVEATLIKRLPAHESLIRANARVYAERLRKLDETIKRDLATIAKEQRILVTAHDAFNYFGRAYDIEVVGVQGISTESEASIARVNRLVDLICSRKVKALFVESTVSDRQMQALIDGCKARGWSVRLGGELFSDAAGPAGSHEGTYVGMIEHNVKTIVEALR